jgi:hypothetical protein
VDGGAQKLFEEKGLSPVKKIKKEEVFASSFVVG